ncbi:MAG: MCE family protein [Betaproteobacteria bacterium]|nr:MCE family protein [Betaproteobacteria bacterium]
MENRAYALITGLFLIGIVAAMVVAAQWLGGDQTVRVPYRVVSTQPVTGLNPQAQVRYRGIGVGRVTAITLDPKDPRRILIDTEVDANIPVTRGTYAQLGMEGITGVAYVHLLDDGKDAKRLPKGAEIETRPSFMDSLSDNAEGLSKDARELIASLNKLVTPENRARLEKTLASLERVSADLEGVSKKLPQTIDHANAWLGDDNRKVARQSLERLNETVAVLPELAREAQRVAKDTRTLVGQMSTLSGEVQGTAASLREGTLPQMGTLAESMERSAVRFGRLAYELERAPDSVLWGRKPARPGPGEPGFQP